MKKLATAMLIAYLSLSGCMTDGVSPFAGASGSGTSRSLTPEEAALQRQEKAFQSTVAQGAIAGAIIGGIFGQMSGGDTQSTLMGAAAGGALGASAGYYVGKRQQQFAAAENSLDGAIAAARADNAELRNYIALARRTVGQQRANLTSLRKQLSAGQITREQYLAELSAAERTRNSIATYYNTSATYEEELRSGAAKAVAENGQAANGFSREAQTFANQRAEVRKILSQSDDMLDAFRLDA